MADKIIMKSESTKETWVYRIYLMTSGLEKRKSQEVKRHAKPGSGGLLYHQRGERSKVQNGVPSHL